MSLLQPRYNKDEYARRGTEMYEQQIRPQVEKNNQGRIVAIDIESGAYELAGDTLTASEMLLSHHPEAQIWCVRIGHRGVHRFGAAQVQQIRNAHRSR